jgi:DNA-binding NarL/FixJ family response regulator
MAKCRVLVADDHILVRQGLQRILMARSDLEIAGEAGNGLELLDLLRKSEPDLVLLDISMPNLRGIEAIPEIKKNHPRIKILVLTMHREEEYLYQAISAGADGYLLKDDADKDLFFAIDAILKGKVYVSRYLAEEFRQDWAQMLRGEKGLPAEEPLTVREREVLKLIAEGRSSKEIGDLLFISTRTAERHRANIMGKLKARKSTDLIRYAIRKGYI